tara:strand:- start:1233 stop:1628 length:396 start_codon:yes stop_codon:yes gene_type:complete
LAVKIFEACSEIFEVTLDFVLAAHRQQARLDIVVNSGDPIIGILLATASIGISGVYAAVDIGELLNRLFARNTTSGLLDHGGEYLHLLGEKRPCCLLVFELSAEAVETSADAVRELIEGHLDGVADGTVRF